MEVTPISAQGPSPRILHPPLFICPHQVAVLNTVYGLRTLGNSVGRRSDTSAGVETPEPCMPHPRENLAPCAPETPLI